METVNFGELKTNGKTLVDEKGIFWSDAQMLNLSNIAMRTVYRQICGVDPSHFAQKTRLTYPADSESIDLTAGSYLNTGTRSIYKVLSVSRLDQNAAVSPTNKPMQLEKTDPETPNGYRDNRNDPNSASRSISSSRQWYLDRDDLYLAPVPNDEIHLLVRWVDQPTDLSSDSDGLFTVGGKSRAAEYHDLVATTLARLMTVKERRMAEEIIEINRWLRVELQQAERSRTQHPQVRYDSPY